MDGQHHHSPEAKRHIDKEKYTNRFMSYLSENCGDLDFSICYEYFYKLLFPFNYVTEDERQG